MLPVLYEHGPKIGQIIFIGEDELGIYVIVGVEINANNLFFSIGFKTIESEFKNTYRYIKKAKIYEISVVNNPAQGDLNCESISRKEFFRILQRFRNKIYVFMRVWIL